MTPSTVVPQVKLTNNGTDPSAMHSYTAFSNSAGIILPSESQVILTTASNPNPMRIAPFSML